jgi:sugar phosphate isomerase/epimerase
VKKLQGRIISLHFKDVKGGADVPWGEGDSDARGQLAELKRQGFKGVLAIEYESAIDEDMSQIAKCVAFFNQVAAELAAGKAK